MYFNELLLCSSQWGFKCGPDTRQRGWAASPNAHHCKRGAGAQSDRLTLEHVLLALQILPLRGEVTLRPFRNSGTVWDPLRTGEQWRAGIRGEPSPLSFIAGKTEILRNEFVRLFPLTASWPFQPHIQDSPNVSSVPFSEWTVGCLLTRLENFSPFSVGPTFCSRVSAVVLVLHLPPFLCSSPVMFGQWNPPCLCSFDWPGVSAWTIPLPFIHRVTTPPPLVPASIKPFLTPRARIHDLPLCQEIYPSFKLQLNLSTLWSLL